MATPNDIRSRILATITEVLDSPYQGRSRLEEVIARDIDRHRHVTRVQPHWRLFTKDADELENKVRAS